MRAFFVLFFLLNLSLFAKHIEDELAEQVAKKATQSFPSLSVAAAAVERITPADESYTQIVSVDLSQKIRDNGTFSADLQNSKGAKKRFFFKYKLEAYLSIPVAKADIPKDKMLTLDDVEYENARFSGLNKVPLDKSDFGKVVATKHIRAKAPIYEGDAKLPAVITKNSPILLTVVDGGIQVQSEAIALEDGRIGESINVRLKNGRTLKAYINSDMKVIAK